MAETTKPSQSGQVTEPDRSTDQWIELKCLVVLLLAVAGGVTTAFYGMMVAADNILMAPALSALMPLISFPQALWFITARTLKGRLMITLASALGMAISTVAVMYYFINAAP